MTKLNVNIRLDTNEEEYSVETQDKDEEEATIEEEETIEGEEAIEEGGFQVTYIFNIYSKVSSYTDIRRIFKLQVTDIFNIYSTFKLHGYSRDIQISSQSNFWMHRSLKFEYPANIHVT